MSDLKYYEAESVFSPPFTLIQVHHKNNVYKSLDISDGKNHALEKSSSLLWWEMKKKDIIINDSH